MNKSRKKAVSFKVLTFLGLVSLLVISCADSQSEEKVDTVDFSNFHITKCTINPSIDTTIFGKQGTRVFIKAESFWFPDSNIVTNSVNIELKEFYKKEDLILSDLSMSTNGILMESFGTVHISASAKEQELILNENKKIVVHLAKDTSDGRKLDLYYSSELGSADSIVSSWYQDSLSISNRTLKLASFGWWYPSREDTTDYDFKLKNYTDSGSYWNPLDYYVESYNFSETTKKEVETVLNKNTFPGFEYWNDYGVQCDMKISTKGFIKDIIVKTPVSNSTRNEITQFFKDLPQLEPGKNKDGDIIERRGMVFIQGGSVIPSYKTDIQYLNSFGSKYAQIENVPIKSIEDIGLNYRVFSISRLGWLSAARQLGSNKSVNMVVEESNSKNVKIKLLLNGFNSLVNAKAVDGMYLFEEVPAGRNGVVFGLKIENGKLYSAFRDVTISSKPIEALEFSETTIGALRVKLAGL